MSKYIKIDWGDSSQQAPSKETFLAYVASLQKQINDNKITVDSQLSDTSENAVQNKVINTALNDKQDKFATVTNPGICKVTMSNSGQTYFCNGASDSGIYFDSSIRLLQGKGIKNDDDLVNKKYVDTEVANNKIFVTTF